MVRRSPGEGTVSYEHDRGTECLDPKFHRRCTGRWRGMIDRGRTADGKRRRRKVSAQTKTALLAKLDRVQAEMEVGQHGVWTVEEAFTAWLKDGLPGRSERTKTKYRLVVAPILNDVGHISLRDLTAREVQAALTEYAKTHADSTVGIARLSLERSINYAVAHGKASRNMAALVEAPEGREGRPSKAMTFDQAIAVLEAAEESRLHGYVVVCLMTGVRTEEARALRWDHVVAWDEDAVAWRPVTEAGWEHKKFAVYVWRSVRKKGETKTRRSRRSISLPQVAVEALRKEQGRQVDERERASSKWEDHGLVFCSSAGKPLDAGNIRRKLKVVTANAGLGKGWTPRELRHTFVSLLSESGVPVEEIARLVGHTSSRTTETVYRKELRPTITAGAEVMDVRFAGTVQAGHTALPATEAASREEQAG